jgi:hypothetical protein
MQKTPFLVTAALAATAFTAPAQRAMQPAAAAPMAAAAAPMQRAEPPPPPRLAPPPQTTAPSEQRSQPTADCGPAVREKDLTPEDKEARAFRVPQSRGKDLAKAVGKVTKELVWQGSLADAQKLAAKEGKPILWIQALGTLKGFL